MFIPVPAPAQMNVWDATALALGIAQEVLMENAARAALDVLRQNCPNLENARALLLMGAGNNGGDAVCLARHLQDAGTRVLVVHSRPLMAYKGAARTFISIAKRLNVPFLSAAHYPGKLPELFYYPDIVIDGLLGTGFSGELRAEELRLVQMINELRHSTALPQYAPLVLALDIPSGLNGLSGKAQPTAVEADFTVSFQAAKPGLILPEARAYVGRLFVRSIGIPWAVQQKNPASFGMVKPFDHYLEQGAERFVQGAWAQLQAREAQKKSLAVAPPCLQWSWPVEQPVKDDLFPAHKGQSGHVLIIGGSSGLMGAPQLAARAALRGGAGLVTMAVPAGLMPQLSHSLPDCMTLPLSLPATARQETADSFGNQEWSQDYTLALAHSVATCSAVVLGPGMGRSRHVVGLLETLLALPERPPFVLDADALYALAGQPELLWLLRPGDVLTPHPGEAATLLRMSAQAVQADRLAALQRLELLNPQALWVLKGVGTLVGTGQSTTLVCPVNAPNLAVAGSGDVLAGLLGAVLAGLHKQACQFSSAACQLGSAASQEQSEAGLKNMAGACSQVSPTALAWLAAAKAVHAHALAGLLLEAHFARRGNGATEIAEMLPQALTLLPTVKEEWLCV